MRRLLTVLLLACAAGGLWIGPAQAHNVLVSSDPRDGAALSAAPGQVTLVFDQPVRQGYAQIGVTGPNGTAWGAGKTTVAKEKVTLALKPLTESGAYVIGYRILSSDGHPVTGKVTFTFTASGASAAPAPPGAGEPRPQGDLSAQAAEAAANGGASMAVLWIGGALVLLAAGTVIALRRGARP